MGRNKNMDGIAENSVSLYRPRWSDTYLSKIVFENLELPVATVEKMDEILQSLDMGDEEFMRGRAWSGKFEPEMAPLIDVWIEFGHNINDLGRLNVLMLIFEGKFKSPVFLKSFLLNQKEEFKSVVWDASYLLPNYEITRSKRHMGLKMNAKMTAKHVETIAKISEFYAKDGSTWGEIHDKDAEFVHFRQAEPFAHLVVLNYLTSNNLFDNPIIRDTTFEECLNFLNRYKTETPEITRIALEYIKEHEVVGLTGELQFPVPDDSISEAVSWIETWEKHFKKNDIYDYLKLPSRTIFRQMIVLLGIKRGEESIKEFFDLFVVNALRLEQDSVDAYLNYIFSDKPAKYDNHILGMIVEGYMVDGVLKVPSTD